MIKFRCSICDKKIGVPDDYAGKQVACPECSQPAVVPELAAPDEPVLDAPPDDGIWSDDVLAASSPSASATAQVNGYVTGSITCPSCGATLDPDAALCRQCGQSLQPAVAVTAACPGMSRFGLAVAGSCAGAVLGGFIWALIVRFTGYEIGWVAWDIGFLAGLGAVILTPERSVRLAVIAGAMAALGLIAEKLFIFSWMAAGEVEAVLSEGAPQVLVDSLLADPASMFRIACNELVKRGELSEDIVDDVKDSFGLDPDQGMPEDIIAGRERAFALLEELSDQEKEAIVQEQTREQAARIAEAVAGSVPLVDRIKMSLTIWDAIWGFFAIGTAFKIALAGSKE